MAHEKTCLNLFELTTPFKHEKLVSGALTALQIEKSLIEKRELQKRIEELENQQ